MSGIRRLGSFPAGSLLPRWDAVIIRWELTPDERTGLLACGLEGAVDDVAIYRADEAERRIRLILQLAASLDQAFGDEAKIRCWLRAANRGLEGLTPIEAMASSTEWTKRLISALDAMS